MSKGTQEADWGEVEIADISASFADLAGKSVVITGGGSGIGAALVEGFLAQRAKVAFLDVMPSEKLCRTLGRKFDNPPIFCQCDVTDTKAVRAAVDFISAKQGSVQVLVNCAANDKRCLTENVTEEFWNWSLDINLKAYFFAAQTVVGPMKTAGNGVIINFSSVAYMMGLAGFPCYTAANAAIVSLTHSLAREFGGAGIRVNAIAPGMVLTDRQKKLWLTPEDVTAHVNNQCLPRPLVPKDIVGPALFLASDASSMMTAQTLIVDGGFITRT